jgi:nucleotide-binding universal stress UspA family protein
MAASRPSVLVAYDGSDVAARALEHAADLVGAGGAVSVINVVEAQSVSSRLVTVSDAQRTDQDELLGEAERLLARRRVSATLIRAAGDRSEEILSAARAIGADVIVVGGTGRPRRTSSTARSAARWPAGRAPTSSSCTDQAGCSRASARGSRP